ncbi:hypothetical protein, partial [Mesorhizobium sp. M4B.F.Ca.ET.089.01.1.1]|uniref:hypothetical protein n=1 Tax=Mesorhizobium sp. M4B.F.Ca.ET.089.01.1.1 TaxID=2496662 RepID=UPI001AECF413
IWPKPFPGKALRIRNGAAQPARQRDRRGGHGGSERRRLVARRGRGAQNHRGQDESWRRFPQASQAKTAALVECAKRTIKLHYPSFSSLYVALPGSLEKPGNARFQASFSP